ncbi:MAG TPA: hypothetical protein PKE29_13435 [Phycisphaerales bacterium]|nr:hypothetical protein [Phycisphaerales bacterium]
MAKMRTAARGGATGRKAPKLRDQDRGEELRKKLEFLLKVERIPQVDPDTDPHWHEWHAAEALQRLQSGVALAERTAHLDGFNEPRAAVRAVKLARHALHFARHLEFLWELEKPNTGGLTWFDVADVARVFETLMRLLLSSHRAWAAYRLTEGTPDGLRLTRLSSPNSLVIAGACGNPVYMAVCLANRVGRDFLSAVRDAMPVAEIMDRSALNRLAYSDALKESELQVAELLAGAPGILARCVWLPCSGHATLPSRVVADAEWEVLDSRLVDLIAMLEHEAQTPTSAQGSCPTGSVVAADSEPTGPTPRVSVRWLAEHFIDPRSGKALPYPRALELVKDGTIPSLPSKGEGSKFLVDLDAAEKGLRRRGYEMRRDATTPVVKRREARASVTERKSAA